MEPTSGQSTSGQSGRRKITLQEFNDLKAEAHGEEYDNPAFFQEARPVTITRYPGSFANGGRPESNSFKRDAEQRESQDTRNKRRCIIITIVIVAVVLVLAVVGAVLGVILSMGDKSDSTTTSSPTPTTTTVTRDYPGEATFRNLVFSEAYRDPTSTLYRQLERDFIDKMDHQFSQSPLSDNYVNATLSGFRNGSVIADFIMTFTADVVVLQEGPIVDLVLVDTVVELVDIVESAEVAETSFCIPSPCINGGTCERGISSYRCACRPGFTGNLCQTDINECLPDPCENAASCTDNENSFTCTCIPGYTGTRCETNINECQAVPCEHGGTCIDEVNRYTCSCVDGYTGTNCETNINECEPNICLNGGTCNDGINSYSCSCRDGYNGDHCQININECVSNPCLNGAICKDGVNFYTCQCLDGFHGVNCENEINECANAPCVNGGICLDGINTYTCKCPDGYTGSICQTEINECASGPCKNGGSCADRVGAYICTCKEGYTGVNCDTDIDECQPNPCLNGGTCTDQVNSYMCTCMDGYTGNNCQFMISTRPPLTTVRPVITIPPVQLISCDSGFRNVEGWMILYSYTYSSNLQNQGSDEYIEQSNFVDSMTPVLFGDQGPLISGNIHLAAFQRMNGSMNTVATIQVCVSSEVADLRALYSTVGAGNTSAFGFLLIGLREMDGTRLEGRPVNFTCPASYHVCSDEDRCIPFSFVCDGETDCTTGEDEDLDTCSATSSTTYTPMTGSSMATTPEPCTDEEYQCYTTYECIHKDLVCDGTENCKDNSDEWYCPTTPVSRPAGVEVRLMDSNMVTTDQMYGRVEIRPTGSDALFGSICDDMFGVEEAKVVCRQLGYNTDDNVFAFHGAKYGESAGPIYLGSLRCTGNEANLMECESLEPWGYIFCGHNQDAAVSCGFEATTMSTMSTPISVTPPSLLRNVRLYGGDSCLEGNLEVLLNGLWGTVCDDFFTEKEASVVCKSLGFSSVELFGNNVVDTDSSDKNINMDDVICTGNETSIFDCDYTVDHNCAHSEDVGIRCKGDPVIDCYRGPVPESVNCDFNLHNCQYKQETLSGNATWTQGNYQQLKSRDPFMFLSHVQGTARLTSPTFEGSSEPHRVEFMYSIKNSHYNNLRLILNEMTTMPGSGDVAYKEMELWKSIYLRSDEDFTWIYHCEDLQVTSDKKYNLIFEAASDMDIQIGLDNVKVATGPCKNNLLSGVCTFDHPNKCGAVFECSPCRRNNPTYRWYWTEKMTDKLVHANAVFGEEGSKAVLSFTLPYLQRDWSVRFRAHMAGIDTGMLKISLMINGTGYIIDTLKGRQQDGWFYTCMKLPSVLLKPHYDLELVFEATRGAGPDGDIYLDDIEVVPQAKCNVTDLEIKADWMVSNSSDQYVWMYREEPKMSLIRFMDPEYDSESEGRVEIYHDGEYRAICSLNFDPLSADVICNMFGYLNGNFYTVTSSTPFWISDVVCTGEESTILDCEYSDWGNTTGCTEDDHVYVYCSDMYEEPHVPYFDRHYFFIKDSNTENGGWSTLMSRKMIISDQSTPVKLLFDLHKPSSDIIKVHVRDGSTNLTTLVGSITNSYEMKRICMDLPQGHYHVGLTAIKDTNMGSKDEIKNLEIGHGHCKATTGREFCDFESEFTGCDYSVTSSGSICVSSNVWERMAASRYLSDSTFKSLMGHFMYIDNRQSTTGTPPSVLQLRQFDIVQDVVPFACSVRFSYFVQGGSLTLEVNTAQTQFMPFVPRPYMWRQGCVMISPGNACPLQSGTVDIRVIADGVEAGLDDIYLSAESCPSTDNITCEFDEFDDACGFSWTSNVTTSNGSIVDTDLEGNFAIVSPDFVTTATDICITVDNIVFRDYNLSATVYNMQGAIINSTYSDEWDEDVFLTLNVKTTPGISYILLIEGLPYFPFSFRIPTLVAIDNVRMFNQPCHDIVFPCRRVETACGDGTCTMNHNICDGKRDCSNGMDEQICDCSAKHVMDPLVNCSTSGCIRSSLYCDGVPDCEDGSDETMCESSVSCEFEDPYACGYSLYNANYDLFMNVVQLYPFFGYMESPVETISTESCLTIKFGWELVNYANQTSIRCISNTSNSLSVLSDFEVPAYRPMESDRQPMHTVSVNLPTGTYSVIFEVQGMYAEVAEVSMMSGECMVQTTPSSVTRDDSLSRTDVTSSRPPSTTTMDTLTPDDFPTVMAVTERVDVVYGQDVDISCMIVSSPAYQGALYWYIGDTILAWNEDIMLEDIDQTKYKADITVTSSANLNSMMYTLTIHDVGPMDTNMRYECSMRVYGYPESLAQRAVVYLNTPVQSNTDTCVANPIYACSEAGFPYYMLPSVTGLTTHSQVQKRLVDIFYSNHTDPTDTCQSMLRDLSCGLHTPKCNDQEQTQHVCRENCEDIYRTCWGSMPSIVYNSNADVDYFCKFLPFSSEDSSCHRIDFECGSHINTSAEEFRFRSERFPSAPPSQTCAYTISGPPMKTYFHWLEITVDSLTLDQQCGQSNLMIDDELLCFADTSTLPKVVLIEKPTAELILQPGISGAFVATVKYVYPNDLCSIYVIPRNDTLIEATQDLVCSRWIITLDTALHEDYYLQLDVISILNGCIQLDEHTGSGLVEVCAEGKVNVTSKNVTVLRESTNVIFTLNYTAVMIPDPESSVDPNLQAVKIELVGGTSDNEGYLQIYRADGVHGTVCGIGFYTVFAVCPLVGYETFETYWTLEYSSNPEIPAAGVAFLDCFTTNLNECTIEWLDQCPACSCPVAVFMKCDAGTPENVSCVFSDSRCGYNITVHDHSKTFMSPMFDYSEESSLKISVQLRGVEGDTMKISLIQGDITEDLWSLSSPYHVLDGMFEACVTLPSDRMNMDVRLKYELMFGQNFTSPDGMFDIISVEFLSESCPDAFPDSVCSFDDLNVCLPLIEAACPPDDVWSIMNGKLVGDTKYGEPGAIYTYDITLPTVSQTTTKYFHFNYMNNGSLYYNSQINFKMNYAVGTSSTATLFEDVGTLGLTYSECVPIELVPNVATTLQFELASNHSLGYIIIDDLAMSNIKCPHVASCNFEKKCNITYNMQMQSASEIILHWNITAAKDSGTMDHTFMEHSKGHMMSIFDDYSIPGGAQAWFRMEVKQVDSQYKCLSFYYKTHHIASPDASFAFFTVTANYTSSNQNTVRTYGISEYIQKYDWTEGHVPIDVDLGENMTFTFMATKLYDDSQMWIDVDDIKLESFNCKYGLENMDMCTFDEPMKCLYTANCTVGSGYIWDLYRMTKAAETESYLQVESAYGDAGAQSYLAFEIDLSDETSNTYYQFKYKSMGEAGTLQTFLETTDTNDKRRRKRTTHTLYDVSLQGANIWYWSECFNIPSNFKGHIYFLATRGQGQNGLIALDDVQIKRGSCQAPSIDCDFRVQNCGYTTKGGWIQNSNGMSSETKGSNLIVPLQKLQYQTACLRFQGDLAEELSVLEAHVMTATKTDIYTFEKESGTGFTGQVNVSQTDTWSVMFSPASNRKVFITSMSVSDGSCSNLDCAFGEFQCEEKCIRQQKVCNSMQDCYTGFDEDSCGFSLDCQFTSGNTCSYTELSDASVSWQPMNNYIHTDEKSLQTNIVSGTGGFLFTTFPTYNTDHARLQSKITNILSDSCLLVTYAGTVAKMDVVITYENSPMSHWSDVSVKGDNLEWKTSMIPISPGHVSILLEASMVGMQNGLPYLLKDSFLIIEEIKLETQQCENLIHPGCPAGTQLCADRSVCYPNKLFCDGVVHCQDGSDESFNQCLQVNKVECTFEEPDICFYKNVESSTNHEWIRQKAFPLELPEYDKTYGNRSGHFLYHSKTTSLSGIAHNATIESLPVMYDVDSCVTFWYFMNSTQFVPNSLTAQIFVSVVYLDGTGMENNLLWYDSTDRLLNDWIQGAVPVQANRPAKLQITGKTFTALPEVWPGMVAFDDPHVMPGNCPITQDCRPDSFECTFPKVCIPNYFLCDGTVHCSDGSDERSCAKPEGRFDVTGGDGSYGQVRVFKDSAWRPVCSSYNDNENQYTAQVICRQLGFRGLSEGFTYTGSDTNQIAAKLNCTSEDHCEMTLESVNCIDRLGVRCSEAVCFSGERLCPGTKFECIPEIRFCDGLPDCDDYGDEEYCANCSSVGLFECHNHECQPLSSRCNGINDCSDGTDEYRCVQLDNSSVTVWDKYARSRKQICINSIDRKTAERLCSLSGSGYLDVPEIRGGMEKITNGMVISASTDSSSGSLIPGLDVVTSSTECYPLELSCVLPECGTTAYQDDIVEPYIFYGDEAAPGEWPWHCSVNVWGYFICGCSYIGKNYILTAGHCILGPQYRPITIILGSLEQTTEGPHGQSYNATRAHVHPNYIGFDTEGSLSDMAIIELPVEPTINNYTRPVCLGDRSDMAYIRSLGRDAECYSIGMGYTENSDIVGRANDNPPLLEKRAHIVDMDTCNNTWGYYNLSIYDDSVCVQDVTPYSITCNGDSGGSLTCKDTRDGRWKQFGVTSFGLTGCYSHIFPDVYNSVPMFLDWIEEKTGLDFT